jgi:TRAP-type mannitol/chloroaromatic compound transport system permease large subunit
MMFLGLANTDRSCGVGALATIIVDIVMGRFNYKMLNDSLKARWK